MWDYNGTIWSQMTANDLTFDGTYASFTVSALNGYDYAVVGAPIGPGDANRDGIVDVNDLTIVLSHFGRTGMTWSGGDFNGDGRVDVNDLTILLSRFGASSGAGLQAVPEPCALAILAAAGLVGLLACAGRRLCYVLS